MNWLTREDATPSSLRTSEASVAIQAASTLAMTPKNDHAALMVWTAPYGISVCQDECRQPTHREEPSMEQLIRIGIDTSKSVFQLHGVNAAEEPVLRRKLRRRDVLKFFAKLSPTVVGMEACGASHYWAREIAALGHEVKLLPAQYVKAYVKRNKNDPADAEAVCEAMSRPTMRFVAVKTAERQAALMMVTIRDRLVRARTQLTNSIRGHAAEFGLVAPKGVCQVEPLLARIAADESLPALAREFFRELGEELGNLQARLRGVEAKLMAWHRADACSRRLTQIPAVGPISATLLSLKAPDPHLFRSGRDFAAWAGLTPQDHSTADKRRLGVITRAGDEALRSVLVVGAMSVIGKVKRGRMTPSPWLAGLLARKAPKEVAVALANKNARIAWKMMVSGEDYDPARAMPALAASRG
jgi:transposase